MYENIIEMIENAQYKDALTEIEKINNSKWEKYNLKGIILFQTENIELAIRFFKKALSIEKNNDIYYNLALCYYKKSMFKISWNILMNLNNKDEKIFYLLSYIEFEQRDFTQLKKIDYYSSAKFKINDLNKKVKYLHFMIDSPISKKYIEFINENFTKEDHKFIIISNDVFTDDYYVINNIESIRLLATNYEKILLHGIFNYEVMYYLFLNEEKIDFKKVYWFIWGGDLYYYKFRKNNFNSDLFEFVRKKILKKIVNIITVTSEYDFELAKKWYKINAKKYLLLYPNLIDYKFLKRLKNKKRSSCNLRIQLGNSGDPSNKHIEMLNILSKFKNENIEIITPLSYGGSKNYIEKVIETGKDIFGKKFNYLKNFLPPQEYGKFLSSVDLAIFNHDRQQAFGNILYLLFLGKKVFLKNDTTSWKTLKEKNLIVWNTYDIYQMTYNDLIEINESDKNINSAIIEEEYSFETRFKLWKDFFDNKNNY
ncbi:4-alpha-L-fucosyltransferase (glycosyl transferase family 56) [Oceanotoga teriensis]|uniref:4-alpha-L-fucosyltransferase (Glycosyl transferase family 56) n=1 Tax=Oceanotoga teriensis TaxID=515440 RepID=A0AA45C818_9BACT|nr:TDP-N-acetylfucosamine:lipid II N-acetylfucosaminyltransferase [Oceanotoga teriensis]PWJ95852.1 4-alpha-L-fucosyltransferase (glycosyl transferase family 56) [Oceanotoga teriensis]